MKTQPGTIEYQAGGEQSPRGLVIETLPAGGPDNGPPACRLRATLPHQWRTLTRWSDPHLGLDLIAVGHMYARAAQSFDVSESLELLGRAYRTGGVDALNDAIGGGMFALIVVDHSTGRLRAFCDLLACMPLFYAVDGSTVTLATNQFDLLAGREVSDSACMEYLTYGYLPFSPSLIEGVERLGPGQILTVDLNRGGSMSVSEEVLPAYPPLHERITDVGEACERLDKLFTQYFDRLGDEPIAAGLSGGYDSRLIAAYTAEKNRRLVTFGNPGTVEAEVAQQVAAALGTSTELFDIPAGAPSRFIDDFRYGMQTLDSLEMSHVFAILDMLLESEPAYLIDGFLGGEAMGSHYYYKLSGDFEPVWKVLLARDQYRRPPMGSPRYAERLRNLYGRRIDLPQRDPEEDWGRLEQMAAEQHALCDSDADMLELLSYRLRTRCVIACGPVTFLRRASTLCPFYDRDVFETCLAIDKSLRAGDRMYNAFWRHRFPNLAGIQKESTGGRASQWDISYRTTHLRIALRRRVASRFLSRFIGATRSGGDMQDAVSRYLTCEQNRKLFDERPSHPVMSTLPSWVNQLWSENDRAIENNGILKLRSASLTALANIGDE